MAISKKKKRMIRRMLRQQEKRSFQLRQQAEQAYQKALEEQRALLSYSDKYEEGLPWYEDTESNWVGPHYVPKYDVDIMEWGLVDISGR